jgi:hypothetical protein
MMGGPRRASVRIDVTEARASMEGNWERAAVPVLKWALVPLAVFGFGYFVVGPKLSGGEPEPRNQEPTETALVNQRPIEPGARKWMPVSPPQVNISVTPKEEPEYDYDAYPFDEAVPPPIDPPEGGTVDEAGVGGIAPPDTAGGDRSSGTGEVRDEEKPERRSAFRGIGNWR